MKPYFITCREAMAARLLLQVSSPTPGVEEGWDGEGVLQEGRKQTRIVRGRLDTVRVLCCQQRVSTLSQGAPGLPTKALSASVSMRSTDRVGCPAAFMGASMEWTQEGLTTEHFEAHPLTCLQALTGCLLCADGVLGPGEQRGGWAGPGPHLRVHSPGWADRKSRKQCIGW